jgi:hypothetical protein
MTGHDFKLVSFGDTYPSPDMTLLSVDAFFLRNDLMPVVARSGITLMGEVAWQYRIVSPNMRVRVLVSKFSDALTSHDAHTRLGALREKKTVSTRASRMPKWWCSMPASPCRSVQLGENRMTSRSQIENAIRTLYAARVRGDLKGILRELGENILFEFNGRGTGIEILSVPVMGKYDFGRLLQEFIKNWRFDDWKECSLLVDGEKALLHWTARVTYTPTNRSEQIETLDVITFYNGKIVRFFQCTDTALLLSLVGGSEVPP